MKLIRLLLRCGYAFACPQACVLCERWVVNETLSPLCPSCLGGLEPCALPTCPICGVPVPGNLVEPGYPCSRCRREAVSFDLARAWGTYGGDLRKVIQAFKFGGSRRLAHPLADLMAEGYRRHFAGAGIDRLIPVPLHPKRLRQRGFNQTEMLARIVGKELGLPLFRGVARVRDTASQVGLNLTERRKNLVKAFQVTDADPLNGQRVLIVDDVLTTATTVGELSRQLRADSSVEFIGVLTIARAGREAM